MRTVYLDLETTGLDPRIDEIREIGIPGLSVKNPHSEGCLGLAHVVQLKHSYDISENYSMPVQLSGGLLAKSTFALCTLLTCSVASGDELTEAKREALDSISATQASEYRQGNDDTARALDRAHIEIQSSTSVSEVWEKHTDAMEGNDSD